MKIMPHARDRTGVNAALDAKPVGTAPTGAER
jgi:hypothetical protein